MLAADIMTGHPQSVTSKCKIRDAITLLRDLDVRHLPVVDEGELVGMVSDRDLKAYSLPEIEYLEEHEQIALLDAPVGSIMHSDVVSVERETAVTEIIDLLVDNKIGAVPVVEHPGERLVGIVSYVDILQSLRETAR